MARAFHPSHWGADERLAALFIGSALIGPLAVLATVIFMRGCIVP